MSLELLSVEHWNFGTLATGYPGAGANRLVGPPARRGNSSISKILCFCCDDFFRFFRSSRFLFFSSNSGMPGPDAGVSLVVQFVSEPCIAVFDNASGQHHVRLLRLVEFEQPLVVR